MGSDGVTKFMFHHSRTGTSLKDSYRHLVKSGQFESKYIDIVCGAACFLNASWKLSPLIVIDQDSKYVKSVMAKSNASKDVLKMLTSRMRTLENVS